MAVLYRMNKCLIGRNKVTCRTKSDGATLTIRVAPQPPPDMGEGCLLNQRPGSAAKQPITILHRDIFLLQSHNSGYIISVIHS